MFRNKSALPVKRAAAALVSGSVKKGVSFITATGEIYGEFLEHVKGKSQLPVRTLWLICGPPGAEAPPIRALVKQSITIVSTGRNFEDLEAFFTEEVNAFTDPDAAHDTSAKTANPYTRKFLCLT
jgi:hypothetical protein